MSTRAQKHIMLKKRISIFVLLFSLAIPVSAIASEQQGGKLVGKVQINGLTVSNAVVYLVPSDDRKLRPLPMIQTIVQKQTRFKPSFMVVTVGSTIRFENHDEKIHNVNSQHPPNRFDLGSHLPKMSKEVVLSQAGIVPVRCKVHEKMKAWIYVSPSPYYALTDEDGQFEINNIPFGAYRVETWYFNLSPIERQAGSTHIDILKSQMEIVLNFKSANPGKDFSDVLIRDWRPVLAEIKTSLNKAIRQWEKQKKTSATVFVMTARSKLFQGSGFRNAIAKNQGETIAEKYDSRFDEIRKSIQGLNKRNIEASSLRKEVDGLLSDLMKDLLEIGNP